MKRLDNEYYQFIDEIESYKSKCQITDPDGYDLLFECLDKKIEEKLNVDDEILSYDEKEEAEYILRMQ